MKFNTQAKIMGAKKFNDTIDGQHHDFTKLFIETELDESRDNAVGFAHSEYNFGTSAEYDKLKHLPFPFLADLTIELSTTGKRETKRVIALKPVQSAQAK